MKKSIITTTIILFLICAKAQIHSFGIPWSIESSSENIRSANQLYFLNIPQVNIQALLHEDSLLTEADSMGLYFRFGKAQKTEINILQAGLWDTLSNGDKICRIGIVCTGALSINLIFSNFYMPDSSKFYVYSLTKGILLGAFTSANNQPHGKFSTDVIAEDSIYLEYNEKSGNSTSPSIILSKTIYGYKNISGNPEVESICHIEVNCPEGAEWCVEKHSVCMILYGDNEQLGTGVLVNNIYNDFTPYVVTSMHVVDIGCDTDGDGDPDFGAGDQQINTCEMNNVETWIFKFNNYSPICNNPDIDPPSFSISGSEFKAAHRYTDIALLKMSSAPNLNTSIVYAGWRGAPNLYPPVGTFLGHPGAYLMKVSLAGPLIQTDLFGIEFWNPPFYPVFWRHAGRAQPGSSGSPLFNHESHLLTGILKGSTYGCKPLPEPPGDFVLSGIFRFAYDGYPLVSPNSDEHLQPWLDPTNSAYPNVVLHLAPPVHINNNTFSGGPNFYSTLNELTIEGYLFFPPSIPFFNITYPPSNTPVIFDNTSNTIVKSENRIVIKNGTQIVEGAYFRAYIDDVTCADNIVYGGNNLRTIQQLSPVAEVKPKTQNAQEQQQFETKDYGVKIIPNPSTGIFAIFITESTPEKIIVYDVLGNVVWQKENSEQLKIFNADLSTQPKGIYFLKIISEDKIYSQKLIIQ